MTKHLSRVLLVMFVIIIAAAMPAAAQNGGTGAPPPPEVPLIELPTGVFPPGTIFVQPNILVIPPPGILPLTEDGIIVSLIAAIGPSSFAPLNLPFLDESGVQIEGTIFIPLLDIPLIVRLELVTEEDLALLLESLELSIPEEIEDWDLTPFTFDLFSLSGDEITDFEENPIVPAFAVDDLDNPPVLLQLNPETGELTPVPFYIPEGADPNDPAVANGLVLTDDGWVVMYEITDTTGIFILAQPPTP